MRASAVVEKAGIPTATLVCDGFLGQAAAIPPGLGIESFRINELLGRAPSVMEDRRSTLKLAKKK